ncbi:unnamed protein product, partial [Ectocarpus sp. 13 AM-2016]
SKEFKLPYQQLSPPKRAGAGLLRQAAAGSGARSLHLTLACPLLRDRAIWIVCTELSRSKATALKHVEEEINMAMQRRLAAADSNL